MPPTGSIFTDWQQVEEESRLLMNEDFSWSEPPQRRRRRITEEPIRARSRAAVLEHGYEPLSERDLSVLEPLDGRVTAVDGIDEGAGWAEPAGAPSNFDEMMEQWNAQYGDAVGRAFDLSDPGAQVATTGARRTVVITGRGDERYVPAPRHSRGAALRFHERSTFSPDRAGLWAVLLSIALVIGCLAH